MKIYTPKFLKIIKKFCIHEAGHALVTFKLGVPIKFVQIEIKLFGNLMIANGLTEHEIEKMNEDLQTNGSSVQTRAFLQHLAISWAGMAAEQLCYPGNRISEGSEDDLKRINERLNSLIEKYEGQAMELNQAAILAAKDLVRENKELLEKLADKLLNGLISNNLFFKIDRLQVLKLFQ